MATRRAFYFGEHGPVWAGSAKAATTRIAKFGKLATLTLTEQPASVVPLYLHRDEALLAIGRPVFQGSGYHGR